MSTTSEIRADVLYEWALDNLEGFREFAERREPEIRDPQSVAVEPPPMRTKYIFRGMVERDILGQVRPLTVLKMKDGTYHNARNASARERSEAAVVFAGGCLNEVDAQEAELLREAGYTVQEVQVPA